MAQIIAYLRHEQAIERRALCTREFWTCTWRQAFSRVHLNSDPNAFTLTQVVRGGRLKDDLDVGESVNA